MVRLADGDRGSWRTLTRAVHDYHATALAADWQRLRANYRSDVAHRASTLATKGMEGLLATIHPDIRWHSPVLEIDVPRDGDLHLNGRGLLLVPSVFVWPTPRVLCDPDGDGPALVAYPAREPLSVWQRPYGTGTDALAALLGQTRATLLRELAAAEGYTTGGLAARLSVSASAASQHATTCGPPA